MAQATDDSSNSTPMPQTPDELTALAGRLRARADSVVLRDCPEQQRDNLAAAQVIGQLLQLHAEIRATAATVDKLQHLLQIAGGA
jgi:hypothetical protein